MKGSYSQWVEQVASGMCEQTRARLKGDLYLTCLDWFTDGMDPAEARARIVRAAKEDDGELDAAE